MLNSAVEATARGAGGRWVPMPEGRRHHLHATAAVLLVLAGLPFLFHGKLSLEEPNGGIGRRGARRAVPKTDPTGPETDLAAGKRLCFVEDNWAEGLPLLAKGSDDRLRELATADLKDNASPQERVTPRRPLVGFRRQRGRSGVEKLVAAGGILVPSGGSHPACKEAGDPRRG